MLFTGRHNLSLYTCLETATRKFINDKKDFLKLVAHNGKYQMEAFTPRKIMFKAWNTDTKLLMRLNSIDCKRGELFKKDHILLQFTGLYDKQEEEIYEMDILMINHVKYVIQWNLDRNGWYITQLENAKESKPFLADTATKAVRLWSYFESQKS